MITSPEIKEKKTYSFSPTAPPNLKAHPSGKTPLSLSHQAVFPKEIGSRVNIPILYTSSSGPTGNKGSEVHIPSLEQNQRYLSAEKQESLPPVTFNVVTQSNNSEVRNISPTNDLGGDFVASKIHDESIVNDLKVLKHQHRDIYASNKFSLTTDTQLYDKNEGLMESSVGQQKYRSQFRDIVLNTSSSSEKNRISERRLINTKGNKSWRKPDFSYPHLQNLRSTFQKRKKSTSIPVLSLGKTESLFRKKNLQDIGEDKSLNLSKSSDTTKIAEKDFIRNSSVMYSFRLRRPKDTSNHEIQKQKFPRATNCKFSQNTRNRSSYSSKGDHIPNVYYASNVKGLSDSARISDSCTSLESYSRKCSWSIIPIKEQNKIKSQTKVFSEKFSSQCRASLGSTTSGDRLAQNRQPLVSSSSTRSEYRSKIPKFKYFTRKDNSELEIPHKNTLSPDSPDTQIMDEKLDSYLEDNIVELPAGNSNSCSYYTGKTRQIHTTQPNSFWCGRFMALHDQFHNDMLETLVVDEKTYNRFQDGTTLMRQSKSTLNTIKSKETTTGIQYLKDEETRRCKKSFIHLGALCVTDEAKKSLWQFQLAYARSHGKKQLLPSGGRM